MNRGRFLTGFFIAALGVVLLLNNYGILDWSVWYYLGRLWPVLFIIWGALLFTRKSWLPIGLVLIALVMGFGFWGYYYNTGNQISSVVKQDSWQLEPSIKHASLKLDYGAGKLRLTESSDRKLDLSYNHPSQKPDVSFKVNGEEAEYRITQTDNSLFQGLPKQGSKGWVLRLPQDVIWDIAMDAGAVKADLDLSQINLSSLDVDLGAGDISLRLGDRGLETRLKIDAGASRIKVLVPETVDLQVNIEGALTSSNLESAGLVKSGDYYVTPDALASSKVKIELSGAASKFELVRTQSL